MIFLVLSGKMIFLFPENIILFFRRKMKDDLSQKNTWKYDIFFKCPEKMVFPKKSRLNMIFLVLSGKMVFFFRKIYFFFGRKMEDDLSQEIHGNMIFSVYMYKCYKYDITSLQKKSKMIFSRKKVIDILDRILERVPTILCTFMETFIGVFIYCFSVKQKTKNQET